MHTVGIEKRRRPSEEIEMPAKMVTDREKATNALWATGETYADEVAKAFGRRFGPFVMPGETLPDVALMQRLSGREVVHRCQALTAADRAHGQHQREVARLRGERAAAVAGLRRGLVEARQLYERIYPNPGPHGGQSWLGFAGRTPEQPNALAHQAALTIERLRVLATLPPPEQWADLWIDPLAWADELEARRATLSRCLVDLAYAHSAAARTLEAKRQAMKAFDRAYGSAVRELVCLYRLVGLPERAAALPPARLRRDARRPAAKVAKVTVPMGRPPAALPAEGVSEGELRVSRSGEGVSEGELRVQNDAVSASEGELRAQNDGLSASEGELRVRNGDVSASEGELRVRNGAVSGFSRVRRRRPSLRAAYSASLRHRTVSPRHVSAHRRRARL